MFTNLIESDSHRKEFKRRSSFFLFTVAGYALILFAVAIAGVLTYEARVEAQNTELLLVDWVPPVKPVTKPDRPRDNPRMRKPRTSNAPVDPNVTRPQRTEAVAPADDPTKIPDEVGTQASNVLPTTEPVDIGPKDVDPPSSPPAGQSGCTNCTGTAPAERVAPEPPVTPAVKPSQLRVSSRVLVSKVVSLPKPAYPAMAKRIGAYGPVNVQILVDESGNVISATAVSGNATLIGAAVEAARRARFTPTMLNNQPVKVQGVITYNFVLQ